MIRTSIRTSIRASRLAAAVALTAGLAVASGATLLPGAADASAAAGPAAAPGDDPAERTMSVVQQDFELAAPDTFDLTIRLPDGVDSSSLGADGRSAVVRITVHGTVSDRHDVRRLRDGEAAAPAQTVEDVYEIAADVTAADPRLGRPASDQLAISVPVGPVQSDATLLLPREGVHPIDVDLVVDGTIRGELLTFVHSRSTTDAAIGDLPVAILMAQTAPASVADDATVRISDAEVADVTRLAESLEAMDAAVESVDPTASPLPRAALVQPATIQALVELDPELAERVGAMLARSEALSAPKLPIDVSATVASGQQQLYTDWLREGEDVVSSAAPGIRTDRTLFVMEGALSDAAVGYLAGTGVDAIVMGPRWYAEAEGSIQDYGDPTWLQTIELADRSTMPVLRIDPYLGAQLEARPSNPVAAAVDLLAEVLAYRQFIDDQGRSVPRTGLLLARSDAGVIDPAFAGEVARLLAQVHGIDLVTPGDLVSTMDSQLVDGTLGVLTMPVSAGPDMAGRFRLVDEVTLEAYAVASMLPAGDAHAAQWQAVIDTMPSTGLSDDEVDAMAARLRAAFDEFRTGVRGPSPFSFTLTGRAGTIRFRIQNTTDVPLTVMVRLAGAKLTFPVNDIIRQIEPQSQTTVEAVAESKSNGTSQVIVRILTPTGAQIVPDIALTAQVRALTGLGQLITGAMLLVLASWWVRHWRVQRRRDGRVTTVERHPALLGGRGLPHIADESVGAPDHPLEHVDEDPTLETEGGPARERVRDPDRDPAASSLPPS